jgi:hypothetical protein
VEVAAAVQMALVVQAVLAAVELVAQAVVQIHLAKAMQVVAVILHQVIFQQAVAVVMLPSAVTVQAQ